MLDLRALARSWFLQHPRSVGETYPQHLRAAWSYAGTLLVAGIMCFIHGLVPVLFTTAGSRKVSILYRRMVLQRTGVESEDRVKNTMPKICS